MGGMGEVAALFVETGGCYFGLPDVDPWDGEDHIDGSTTVHRDGRDYRGPSPVVAHPSCKRWGRFWHGSTRKPHQYRLGEDGGCFAAALTAVRNYGGVLEHPKDSLAWDYFGIMRPRGEGWQVADSFGGFTCTVDQAHYGHVARKPTWLYAVGVELPSLIWDRAPQRLHPRAVQLHGHEKARRIGMVAMIGGKDKVRIRNATPEPFRDLLLSIARSAHANRKAA
jgi:hypothetical protein